MQSASEAQLHVSEHVSGAEHFGGQRRREARGAAVGAVGAVLDAVCVLGAGAAVVAEGAGGVEKLSEAPAGAPPEGNAKEL